MYILLVSLSILLTYIIYPNSFNLLFNNRINVTNTSINYSIKHISLLYSNILIENYLGLIGFILLITCLIINIKLFFFKKDHYQRKCIVIFFVGIFSLFYSFLLCNISLHKEVRYFAPVIPFFSFIFIPTLTNTNDKIKSIVYILSLISLILIWITKPNVLWKKTNVIRWSENTELPLIIHNINPPAQQTALIPLFNDERPIEFASTFSVMLEKIKKIKRCMLF